MPIRNLTAKEEQKVLENQRLVHYILKKYHFNPSDYDDFFQIGMIGLVKAVITFDENRKFAFATYASKVIHNELRMYFKRNKKTLKNMSINTVLNQHFNGEVTTLEDVLVDEKSTGFEENIEKAQLITYCISIILNYFSNRDAIILLYAIADVSQHDIAKKVGLSQPQISRKIKQMRKKLKEYTEQENVLTEFSILVKTNKDHLDISIPMNLFVHCDELHHNICLQITKIRKPNGAKVTFEGNKVNLSFPKEDKYFAFVADVLYEMVYFHIARK